MITPYPLVCCSCREQIAEGEKARIQPYAGSVVPWTERTRHIGCAPVRVRSMPWRTTRRTA